MTKEQILKRIQKFSKKTLAQSMSVTLESLEKKSMLGKSLDDVLADLAADDQINKWNDLVKRHDKLQDKYLNLS